MKTPEKYVKALSSVERHYSQIKYEALAIAWGCHHFRMYLLWSHCKVVTDHKSLLAILNSPISKAFARIENWRLKLQSFNFEVLYSIGDLNPADYIKTSQGWYKVWQSQSPQRSMSTSWCLKWHLRLQVKKRSVRQPEKMALFKRWCILSQLANEIAWNQWRESTQTASRYLSTSKWNALWGPLKRYCTPLLTGSKIFISS